MLTGCGLLDCTKYNQSPFWDFTTVGGLIRTGVSLIFALIIVYGVFMVVRAVVKIIRSEGDPAKVQEGYSIIRGVYIGIGIIFIGVIGIVLLIYFFGSGNLTIQNPITPDGVNIPI